MQKVLIIGGFARSGKSSTIAILRSMGIPVLSTSELLHDTTNRIVEEIMHGSTGDWGDLSDVETKRKLFITVAEKVLVPVFGRELFSTTVARNANFHQAPLVVIESIGGEEYIKTIKELKKPFVSWNIRRYSEQAGVDIRQLIPDAYTLSNNGNLNDLRDNIKEALMKTWGVYADD